MLAWPAQEGHGESSPSEPTAGRLVARSLDRMSSWATNGHRSMGSATHGCGRRARHARSVSLFWRVLTINGAVLLPPLIHGSSACVARTRTSANPRSPWMSRRKPEPSIAAERAVALTQRPRPIKTQSSGSLRGFVPDPAGGIGVALAEVPSAGSAFGGVGRRRHATPWARALARRLAAKDPIEKSHRSPRLSLGRVVAMGSNPHRLAWHPCQVSIFRRVVAINTALLGRSTRPRVVAGDDLPAHHERGMERAGRRDRAAPHHRCADARARLRTARAGAAPHAGGRPYESRSASSTRSSGTLTGVLLQLDGLTRRVPAEVRGEVAQLQETARDGVEAVREIARGCARPRSTSSDFVPRW